MHFLLDTGVNSPNHAGKITVVMRTYKKWRDKMTIGRIGDNIAM